jgi:hypothetical protein
MINTIFDAATNAEKNGEEKPTMASDMGERTRNVANDVTKTTPRIKQKPVIPPHPRYIKYEDVKADHADQQPIGKIELICIILFVIVFIVASLAKGKH